MLPASVAWQVALVLELADGNLADLIHPEDSSRAVPDLVQLLQVGMTLPCIMRGPICTGRQLVAQFATVCALL